MTRAPTAKARRGKAKARPASGRDAGYRQSADVPRAPAPRARRRKRPAPVTHDVLGLRCHVKEVLLLGETLVLVSDVDGRQVELPLPVLVGKDALADLEHGEAVWLSVRVERKRATR